MNEGMGKSNKYERIFRFGTQFDGRLFIQSIEPKKGGLRKKYIH